MVKQEGFKIKILECSTFGWDLPPSHPQYFIIEMPKTTLKRIKLKIYKAAFGPENFCLLDARFGHNMQIVGCNTCYVAHDMVLSDLWSQGGGLEIPRVGYRPYPYT